MNGIDFDIITRYELGTNAPAGHVLLGQLEVLCNTPAEVRHAIAEAVRQLAHLSAQFDAEQQQQADREREQQERDEAILIAPSLLQPSNRYGKIEV